MRRIIYLLVCFLFTYSALSQVDRIVIGPARIVGSPSKLTLDTLLGRVRLFPGNSNAPPITFGLGTLLSTPKAGALEYDGLHLYITTSSLVRKVLASHTDAIDFDDVAYRSKVNFFSGDTNKFWNWQFVRSGSEARIRSRDASASDATHLRLDTVTNWVNSSIKSTSVALFGGSNYSGSIITNG
ncbi:MAG: hypothetical protein QW194_04195, partial [Candidatus Micrarchaeaceae archaeon]